MQPINLTLDLPITESCSNCFCCFPKKQKKQKDKVSETAKQVFEKQNQKEDVSKKNDSSSF